MSTEIATKLKTACCCNKSKLDISKSPHGVSERQDAKQNRTKPEHISAARTRTSRSPRARWWHTLWYRHHGRQLVPQKLKTAVGNIVLVTFFQAGTKDLSKVT